MDQRRIRAVDRSETSDAALVARARRGDGDAFAALVQPHLDAMLRLAALVNGHRDNAEDIVQESLTRALCNLKTFDPDRPFRPWFATIVTNQARNWSRSQGRYRRLTERIRTAANIQHGQSSEERALQEVEAEAVFRVLANLDVESRSLLALRFVSGLSEAEVASVLGVPVGTVKSRTSRLLQRLRTQTTSEFSYDN